VDVCLLLDVVGKYVILFYMLWLLFSSFTSKMLVICVVGGRLVERFRGIFFLWDKIGLKFSDLMWDEKKTRLKEFVQTRENELYQFLILHQKEHV